MKESKGTKVDEYINPILMDFCAKRLSLDQREMLEKYPRMAQLIRSTYIHKTDIILPKLGFTGATRSVFAEKAADDFRLER